MKKRAKRALDTGDMCRRQRVPSKPGAISRLIKKRAKNARIEKQKPVAET